MPYVNIQITQGATRAQKAQLVKDVTDSIEHVLGKKPEHVHVVIQEICEENWGFAGLLTDEWKNWSSCRFGVDSTVIFYIYRSITAFRTKDAQRMPV